MSERPQLPERAAFIGLGSMGSPIASNLATSGLKIRCLDVDVTRAAAMAEQHAGVEPATSPVEAVAGAQVVFTCLPTSRDVAAVIDASLSSSSEPPAPGALFIDLTSGDPHSTRGIAARLAELGYRMVDAPISGGVARAVTGDLAVMLGGAEQDLDEAEAILRPAGSRFFRCGPIGSGQAMKALNNLVSATGLLIAAEALCLGRGFGLDPDVMVGVLNASTGMNNSTQTKLRQFVLSRSFASGFSLDLMVKDLSIAVGIGAEGIAPLSTAVLEQWRAAQALLGPGHDHTEVARLAEHLSGTELAETAGESGVAR